ncbi:MAG TPA: hypothetical protein ENJ88_08480 [Phaeodactylibacter sp.]|nr:hypothetical protein [Phaeodactylibacter sp.]
MAHLTYEEGKKLAMKGLGILAVVTLAEVFIALIGNGHLIEGFRLARWVMYPAMILLSMYKAYFIIYNFMHLGFEVKSLRLSVLLPTTLLIWAIIAFLQEGYTWGERRHDLNKEKIEMSRQAPPQSEVAVHE